LTRDQVLARGAQVVLVANSGCGQGNAWRSLAFSWRNHVEQTPHGFRDFPDCGPDFTRSDYDTKLVRYYEDSTFVSAATGPTESPAQAQDQMLTPQRVADMTGCGVDLFGFDQILPDDGRIEASIWSWAPDQPDATGGRCTLQRGDGRWVTASCQGLHPAACRTATGWTVTAQAIPYEAAAPTCRGAFDLPRTGYDNSLLRQAAGTEEVWLRYTSP